MHLNLHTDTKHVLNNYQTWKVSYPYNQTLNQNSSLINGQLYYTRSDLETSDLKGEDL